MAHQSALFEDMGVKLDKANGAGDGEEAKLVEEIESMCMNCHENGTTKLLLTRIPFFREIIIMSFDCPECGFANSEVQPAGEIQQRGQKFTFKVEESRDVARQIVKSDTCLLRIEEIDLEIPPGRGQLTNIEGILSMVAQDLERVQPERKEKAPELYLKIETIIGQLTAMSGGYNIPYTLVLDDPAGNSWVEPSTHDVSGQYTRSNYDRTAEQNVALGLAEGATNDDAQPEAETETSAYVNRPEYQARQMYPEMPARPTNANVDDDDIVADQVYSFPATCPGCTKSCTTNMKMVNIPHFKQVVLMSTVCDHCGYRSNEVKTGGEVPEKGRRITVSIENATDMSRDILKSESCALSCPELELSVEPGTLGGRFTTIEGLLTQVKDDLKANIFDTSDTSGKGGDSMPSNEKSQWSIFFDRLDKAIAGEIPFRVILQDPLASSYVQSFTAPEPDSQITMEEYERTAEEEEDLGLTDMVTEGYEEPEAPEMTEEEKAKAFLDKVVKS